MLKNGALNDAPVGSSTHWPWFPQQLDVRLLKKRLNYVQQLKIKFDFLIPNHGFPLRICLKSKIGLGNPW